MMNRAEIATEKEIVCQWCGESAEAHVADPPAGEEGPKPRVPCLGRKSGFLASDKILQASLHSGEFLVHRVSILLCEACLLGMGSECHTPGCALWMHVSPGHPIMRELYEVIDHD
jgi:hypothetical protein